jgi:hypothetical protein
MEERVNRLKLITIQKKIAPLVTKAMGTLVLNGSAQTLITATDQAEKTAVPAADPVTIAQEAMDLDPIAEKTAVPQIDPATKSLEAMDMDPVVSTSSADIQLLRKLLEK